MTLKGYIHSVETGSAVDGPGLRYTVFMQGCLMRCKYCHNRDTWDLDEGEQKTAQQIVDDVKTYLPYFNATQGGITCSGGEPILQAEFLTEVFKQCKDEGIHTCLDTNGFVRHPGPVTDNLIAVTDLVLLDLKQMDDERHKDLTKVSNRYALDFARKLNELNKPTWIRYVIVDGYTDDIASAEALADFIKPMRNIERVELLPYHELGKHKWQAMNEEYELDGVTPPNQQTLTDIENVFKSRGIEVY